VTLGSLACSAPTPSQESPAATPPGHHRSPILGRGVELDEADGARVDSVRPSAHGWALEIRLVVLDDRRSRRLLQQAYRREPRQGDVREELHVGLGEELGIIVLERWRR